MFFFLALWMFLNSGVSDEKGRSKSENKRLKKKSCHSSRRLFERVECASFWEARALFFCSKSLSRHELHDLLSAAEGESQPV